MWHNKQMCVLFCVLFVIGVPSVHSVDDTRFLGVGYNLLTGNPDGGLASHGGIDQGLLYTRKILDVLNPHAVQSEKRSGCATEKSTSVFFGGKSYQDKLKTGVKIDGGGSVGIASFAFSLSARFQKEKNKTSKEHKVFKDDQMVCNFGRVRFQEELARVHTLSVTQGFAAAVCGLSPNYDRINYMDFLDDWGTHVTMAVDLGYKNITRYQTTMSSFVEHVNTVSEADVNANGSYLGFSGSLVVDFEKFKKRSQFQDKFGTYDTTLIIGTPEMPEPVVLQIDPINNMLDSDLWLDKTMLGMHGVCMSSDLKNLAQIQANLKQAVDEYAEYKHAALPTDPALRIPLSWPRGAYGLYMASSGCPTDKSTPWHTGWRLQETENYRAHNSWSTPLHLNGTFESDTILTSFCIKDTTKTSQYALRWPKGDYCILKYGACPSGFSKGWLTWDDEDGKNKNDYGGFLPDGSFDKDTKLEYCCRDDGLPTTQINLPNGKPFYLLRHSRGCQLVRGMNVRDEYVKWDEEWFLFESGNTKSGGAHPYDDGSNDNHKIHFCYYTPKS